MEKQRCQWCLQNELYIKYHDEEWGVPCYSDHHLFEMLNLEGAQAGLSWNTVLQKREYYRKVFDNFDPEKMAKYDEKKKASLLMDSGIIRNKLKVNAFVVNAQVYLNLRDAGISFGDYIWQFTDGQVIQNNREVLSDVPATTTISDAMSKKLKKDGFKFVGSTIIYAFMQACGMVNDHLTNCFRHEQVKIIGQ